MPLFDFRIVLFHFQFKVVSGVTVQWPEHSQATDAADAGKGGFWDQAPPEVGLFTQGQRVKTARLHCARVGSICIFMCASGNPGWTQTVTKKLKCL